MSYFIFSKDLDNIAGSIYKIAESELDLNNLNIHKENYKILEDSQNFNLVKYGNKFPEKYNNNTITYIDTEVGFKPKIEILKGVETETKSAKEFLSEYISSYKIKIKNFLNNNPNHQLFNKWNNYYNQLNNLDLNTIPYPLNKSLEQYFNDIGQPSLSPLQLP